MNNTFRRYGFPVAFGLMVYTSIRMVTDSMSNSQFWDRSLRQNLIEIISVIILAFVTEFLLRIAIRRMSNSRQKIGINTLLKELFRITIVCLLIFNPYLWFIHVLIRQPVTWSDAIIGNFLVLLYILLYYAIARGNTLLKSYVEQQIQIEKLKNEQLQTELKFLKAQYHPHFLFNAINSIYFQMDDNVPAAKQTLEKFADLLRYQLYDQYKPVELQQELHYLENYIHLQKTRAHEQLRVEYYVDPGVNGAMIYPLLLMPLVENAFKHVGGEQWILMDIKKEQDNIWFVIRNSVGPALPHQKAGGLGLDNLKRRLELLYPGNSHLSTDKDQHIFSAFLKLPLHDDLLHYNG